MITSLLDNDLYSVTMSQYAWQYHPNLPVRYEFRNRTFAVPLAWRLDLGKLREAIEQIQSLHWTADDIAWLTSLGYFSDEYLDWLTHKFVLPDVKIGQENGHLQLTYEGPWASAIFWETPLLATVNELYFERFGGFQSEGLQRLSEKISYLQERKTLKFIEFGTRRRHSAAWHHIVMHELASEIPSCLLGTSNMMHARDLALRASGTQAHQLQMVTAALQMQHGYDLGDTINIVHRNWLTLYKTHPELLTTLADTFTTRFFFRSIDTELLSEYNRQRQDSGDPIQIGHVMEYEIEQRGLEPMPIVFSDSLDVRRMSVLEDTFGDEQAGFGWGTDLTNDLGFQPLSIVIKPSAVNPYAASGTYLWLPCVKISDDLAKATGPAKEIAVYKSAVIP